MSIEELQEDTDNVVYSDITDTGTDEVTTSEEPAQPEVDDDLPEKYRGKTAKEIAKMHSEAEKLIGRQAGEVGELRKLTDSILKQQLENTQQKQTVEDDVDIFSDPDKYIQRKLSEHPDIKEAKELKAQLAHQKIVNQLNETHPGYQETISDPSFVEWIQKSKVRQKLYADAHYNFDFESADELLSNWKLLSGATKQKSEDTVKELQDTRTKQLKAAGVDAGGTGVTSNKVYRRADLIRLRMTDPERYMALNDEIMAAYAEGRVR